MKINNSRFDILFLSFISVAFFLLMIFDVNSWYYSAIGDEYPFFELARNIALGKTSLSFIPNQSSMSIFDQRGVYGVVPVAFSLYQALIMKVFGINHVGWIIGTILYVIFSFWLFYFLIKNLFNPRVAALSLFIFASSHYLWAFSHLGYWNIYSFFSLLGALLFFFNGLKTKKGLFFFLAGLFAALGFYEFYFSRLTIFLIFTYIALHFKQLVHQKRSVIFILLGFLILFIPYLLVNKDALIGQIGIRSVFSSSEIPDGERLSFFWKNFSGSFLGLYSNGQIEHFVSGSLVDPITAVFFTIGLILLIYRWKKYYFLIFWFLVALIVAGGFSQYPHIPITRLLFLLPLTSLMAGYGITRVIAFIKPRYFLAIASPLMAVIFIMNLYRFYRETPLKMHLTQEAVTIGAWVEKCNQGKTLVIDNYHESVLRLAINSYQFLQPPVLIKNNELNWTMKENFTCFIFPRAKNEEIQNITNIFERDKFTVDIFSDFSKKTKILVIKKT